MIKFYVGLLCSAMGITCSLSYSQNISINTDGTSGPALFNVGNTVTPPFRVLSTGQVLGLNSGTAAAPSYSFVDNANTGMYRPTLNSLGFSVGGTQGMNINNAGVININQLVGIGNRMLFANAAGDVIVNSTITKIEPLFIRGTGLNNNADRIVRIGNTDLVPGNGRGLNFVIINKTTHAVVSNTTYDTYGDAAASNALATALNGMTNSQIGILTSYDAWEGVVTTNLQSAFLRLGLYKAYRTTVGGSRRPYAAIFEAASSSAVSSSQAFEVEYSDNANQPFSELRGWLIDGGIVVSANIPSGLSTPIGSPALTVNEEGSLFGKFKHITYHNFNFGAFLGPSATVQKAVMPASAAEGYDDCNGCSPGTGQTWITPYSGRLVKVIVRIFNDGGSNPDLRAVISMNINSGGDIDGATTIELNDSGVSTFTVPSTGWNFNAGDRIGLSLKKRGNSSDRIEDMPYFITCVWEFDVNN
jgi:hypothetical protein